LPEPSEGLSPDHSAEIERRNVKAAQDEADAEKNQRAAELAAHPHNQLKKLLLDLQAPRIDLHDRIASLHRGLTALTQLVLTHTPAPDDAELAPSDPELPVGHDFDPKEGPNGQE